MQIYGNKRKRLQEKRVQLSGLVWDTNMAAVTSCEKTYYKVRMLKKCRYKTRTGPTLSHIGKTMSYIVG